MINAVQRYEEANTIPSKLPNNLCLRAQTSDGFDEEDYLVALLLRQVAELDDALVGIACATFKSTSMPHDGFDNVACAAVMQAFRTTSTFGCQASSP